MLRLLHVVRSEDSVVEKWMHWAVVIGRERVLGESCRIDSIDWIGESDEGDEIVRRRRNSTLGRSIAVVASRPVEVGFQVWA